MFRGEENIFSDNIQRARKRVFLALRKILRSHEDAEDIVQESFMRLCALPDQQQVHQPQALLYTTAYRLAIDLIRRRQRNPVLSEDATKLESHHDSQPSAERGLVAQQELVMLWDAIENLPPQRKRAFILRKFHHLSYQDIAEEMNITVGSVRKHLSSALNDCRIYMAKRNNPDTHDAAQTSEMVPSQSLEKLSLQQTRRITS